MFDWIKKLFPTLEQRRFLDMCDKEQDVLTTILLPGIYTYNETMKELGVRTSTVKRAKDFEKYFTANGQAQLDRKYWNAWGFQLEGIAERLYKKIDIIRVYIKRDFQSKVVSDSLTFKQVNVIRLLDLAKFWEDYALKLLHQVIWEECEQNMVASPVKPLVKAQLTWLDENKAHFYRLSSIFAQKDVDFQKTLESISDIVISDVGEQNAAVLGQSADAFKLGFMPVIGDIILLVRERNLAVENEEYEANKSRLQTLQLQLQALRIKLEESGEDVSPALLKQIEYQTNRINELEYKITAYEKKAGVA